MYDDFDFIIQTNLPSKCGDIQNLLEIFPLNVSFSCNCSVLKFE